MISVGNDVFSQDNDSNKSILEITNSKMDSTDNSKLHLLEEYTPEQDSAFNQAVRMRLPASVLLQNNLNYSDRLYTFEKYIRSGKRLDEAINDIKNTPREFFTPTGNEIVQRRIALENAFHVPFVNTLPKISGFQIPVSQIAALLGLIEDVSPDIKYSIDYTVEVEVVVYSVKAVVIATMFKGIQPPGSYKLTWNGRDENGRKAESGDYIAEVIIGKEKYIRKRIFLP